MGLFGDLLGVIPGLTGLTGGVNNLVDDAINPWSAGNVARKNLELQKDTLSYQKALQQTMFNREDNAVQRRVADLKAAGLNPMFAMGQGANAGQEVRLSTPQVDRSSMDARDNRRLAESQMVLNMIQMVSDISKTRAETEAVRAGIGFDRQRLLNETRGLDQADRGLSQTDRQIEISAQRLSHDMRVSGRQLSQRDAEIILSRDRFELEKDYYRLQENRDEIAATLAEKNANKIDEETAMIQLRKSLVPMELAKMLIDGTVSLYDLLASMDRGMRYKDSYTGTLGSIKSISDSVKNQGKYGGQSIIDHIQDLINKALGE